MWLANLKNGETVTENELDWDDLPVEEITCLHLVNGQSSAFIRAREGYQFFQYKKGAVLFNVAASEISKVPVIWQRIGAVINDHGDCIYIESGKAEYTGAGKTQTFDTRFDNVLDMKLNLPHLRISLPEEVILAKQQEMIEIEPRI